MVTIKMGSKRVRIIRSNTGGVTSAGITCQDTHLCYDTIISLACHPSMYTINMMFTTNMYTINMMVMMFTMTKDLNTPDLGILFRI